MAFDINGHGVLDVPCIPIRLAPDKKVGGNFVFGSSLLSVGADFYVSTFTGPAATKGFHYKYERKPAHWEDFEVIGWLALPPAGAPEGTTLRRVTAQEWVEGMRSIKEGSGEEVRMAGVGMLAMHVKATSTKTREVCVGYSRFAVLKEQSQFLLVPSFSPGVEGMQLTVIRLAVNDYNQAEMKVLGNMETPFSINGPAVSLSHLPRPGVGEEWSEYEVTGKTLAFERL